MGYRPDNQALEEPIDDMLKGIDGFTKAVDKRAESQEWRDDHILELQETALELTRIKFTLVKLKQENW